MMRAAAPESGYSPEVTEAELQKATPTEILEILDNEPAARVDLPEFVAPSGMEEENDRKVVVRLFAKAILTEREEDEAKDRARQRVENDKSKKRNLEAEEANELVEDLIDPIDSGLDAIKEVGCPIFEAYEESDNDVGLDKFRVPPKSDKRKLYSNNGKEVGGRVPLNAASIEGLTDINQENRTLRQLGQNARILLDAMYGQTLPDAKGERKNLSAIIDNVARNVSVEATLKDGEHRGYPAVEEHSKQQKNQRDRELLSIAIQLYLLRNPQDAAAVLAALSNVKPGEELDLVALMPGHLDNKNQSVDSFAAIMGALVRRYAVEEMGINPNVVQRDGTQEPEEFTITMSRRAVSQSADLTEWKNPRTLFKGLVPDNAQELTNDATAHRNKRTGDRILLLTTRAMQDNPENAYEIMDAMVAYVPIITKKGSTEEFAAKIEASQEAQDKLRGANLAGRSGQIIREMTNRNADIRAHELAIEQQLLIKAVAELEGYDNGLTPAQAEAYRLVILDAGRMTNRIAQRERLDQIRENLLLLGEVTTEVTPHARNYSKARHYIHGIHTLHIIVANTDDEIRTGNVKRNGRAQDIARNIHGLAYKPADKDEQRENARAVVRALIVNKPGGDNKRMAVNRMWHMYREIGNAAHMREIIQHPTTEGRLNAYMGRERAQQLDQGQRERAIFAYRHARQVLVQELGELRNINVRRPAYRFTERIVRAEGDGVKPPHLVIVRNRMRNMKNQEAERHPARIYGRARRFIIAEAYRKEDEPKTTPAEAEQNAKKEKQTRSIISFIATVQAKFEAKNMTAAELDKFRKEVEQMRRPRVIDVVTSSMPKVVKQVVVSVAMTVGVTVATTTAPVTAPIVAIGGALVALYGAKRAYKTYRQQAEAAGKEGKKALGRRALVAAVGGAALNAAAIAIPFPGNLAVRLGADLVLEVWKATIETDAKVAARKIARAAFANFDQNLETVLQNADSAQVQAIAAKLNEYYKDPQGNNANFRTHEEIMKFKRELQKAKRWDEAVQITKFIEEVLTPQGMNAAMQESFKTVQQEIENADRRIQRGEAIAVGVFAAYQVGKVVGGFGPQIVSAAQGIAETLHTSSTPAQQAFEARMGALDDRLQGQLMENGMPREMALNTHITDIIQTSEGVTYAVADLGGNGFDRDMFIPLSHDGTLQLSGVALSSEYLNPEIINVANNMADGNAPFLRYNDIAGAESLTPTSTNLPGLLNGLLTPDPNIDHLNMDPTGLYVAGLGAILMPFFFRPRKKKVQVVPQAQYQQTPRQQTPQPGAPPSGGQQRSGGGRGSGNGGNNRGRAGAGSGNRGGRQPQGARP
ncbi:MAG: hypothetical protein QY314_03505 [Candidatus Dojkabacteria bacterium]|nr:MAG: hypothetical protein QY314_03505 [Candidatus Dojkabacteria bacterium]